VPPIPRPSCRQFFRRATVSLLGSAATLALLLPPRAALARDGPTANARDFGSIQQAVESLPPTGGMVLLPAGVYDVHQKIRLPSHVELHGEGMDRTILVLADGVRDTMISNANLIGGNTDITVRDLRLQGNRLGQRQWRYDSRLAVGSSSIRSEVWSFGVRFNNVRDSLIMNVEADDFVKDGFYLGYNKYYGVYRTRLIGCRARDNGRNGIALTHGSFNLIQGCDVRDNNRVEKVGGIQLEPDEGLEVSHNLVVENHVSGNHTGIALFTEAPHWDGISTLIANAVCYNRAERNGFVGIWDHYGQGNVFVDNTASGSEKDFGPTDSSRVGEDFAAACRPG
jgi:parallel beta-helix repeat protein